MSDGDTLRINGQAVRLHGIDAPEIGQECQRTTGETFPCGKWAARVLRQMVDGHELTCIGAEHDRYNRLIAKCYLGGQDIAVPLVEQGVVIAYRKYSMDYIGQEKRAFIAERGLWSMKFDSPGTWRAIGSTSDQQRRCAIKGNISGDKRIYHLPGGRFYGKTQVSETKGERWFCTEEEARRAGWRKARG